MKKVDTYRKVIIEMRKLLALMVYMLITRKRGTGYGLSLRWAGSMSLDLVWISRLLQIIDYVNGRKNGHVSVYKLGASETYNNKSNRHNMLIVKGVYLDGRKAEYGNFMMIFLVNTTVTPYPMI